MSKFDGMQLKTEMQNIGVFHKRSKDFYREFADGQKSYGYVEGNVIFAAKSDTGHDCYFMVNPRYYPDEPAASYASIYRKER